MNNMKQFIKDLADIHKVSEERVTNAIASQGRGRNMSILDRLIYQTYDSNTAVTTNGIRQISYDH